VFGGIFLQRPHVALQVLATLSLSQAPEATASAQVTPTALLRFKKIKPCESTQVEQVSHNTGQCVIPCTSPQALFLHPIFLVIKSVVNLKTLSTQISGVGVLGRSVGGGEVVGGKVFGGIFLQRPHVALQVLATLSLSQAPEATASAQVTPTALLRFKKIKPCESTQVEQVSHNTGQCVIPCTSPQALFLHAIFLVIASVANLKTLSLQISGAVVVGGEVGGGEVVGGELFGGFILVPSIAPLQAMPHKILNTRESFISFILCLRLWSDQLVLKIIGFVL